MKKISFAALVFAILVSLISSSYAADKLKKEPVKIVPKKSLPTKKIKPLKPYLTKVKTKLQLRGSRLYLMVSPKPDKVELYYEKKHLKTWGQGSKFDITPYLSESRKKFKFVFYDPKGMTQSKDVSVSKYVYLVKKPPQKLKPKKKPEIQKPPKLLTQKPKKLKPGLPFKKLKKPPAKKTKEPYIDIERVYLKNDRIHVALRNTGAGDLSIAEKHRGKIRVRSKSLDEFWTPSKIDPTFGSSGKGVDFDTKLQLKGLETVWVILENIRGDRQKVAMLKPRSQLGLKKAPPSLPQAIGQNNFRSIQVPPDMGKSIQSLGSAEKDLGRQKGIGGRLPDGLNSPTGGFGTRGGAAGYVKGPSDRDGIGSVEERFSDQMGPIIKTGSGAQIYGQDTDEEQGRQEEPGQETVDIDFTNDPDVAKDQAEWHETYEAVKEDVYVDPVFITKEQDEVAAEEATILLQDAILHVEEEEVDAKDPVQERTADGGNGEENPDGKHINQDKVKAVSSGGPGIRFVPGEQAGEGGVNPQHIQDLGPTQVLTIDGAAATSNNFEDLSKRIQETIKSGGPPIVSD